MTSPCNDIPLFASQTGRSGGTTIPTPSRGTDVSNFGNFVIFIQTPSRWYSLP